MTDTAAPSSTLPRPEAEPTDDDLVARWRHSADVVVDGEPAPGPAGRQPAGDESRPAGRARRSFPHLRRAPVLVSLLLVAALAGAGWFAYRDHAERSAAADRHAAATAATSDALALATYDYGHLDRFFAGVKAFSTPGFGSTFDTQAQSLVKVLTQYKANATGKLASYGVKSANGNRITVLVVVDQTVANSATKTPSVQTEAFEYTMVHQGSRWLLGAVATVH